MKEDSEQNGREEMTCIAALVDRKSGKGYIGGDRRKVSDGGTVFTDSNETKIWKDAKHNLLFGFTGNTSLGQLMHYGAPLPEGEIDSANLCQYLYCNWRPVLREAVKSAGLMRIVDGLEKVEGHLLICTEQAILYVDSSFAILDVGSPYFSVGSGGSLATGALACMQEDKVQLSPKKQLRKAITIAMRHCQTVGGSIDILST